MFFTGLTESNSGLVQVVVDNFDATISSQNGLKSTHVLAMLLTQPDFKGSDSQPRKICRLKHYEITEEITPDLQIQSYTGPKKPSMPINQIKHCVPPLKILAQQSIRHARASNLDFQFLKTIVTDPNTPEFSGFNTQFMREHNQTPNPATKAVYTPLIDMTPSDPATIMTAMMEAQKLTKRQVRLLQL